MFELFAWLLYLAGFCLIGTFVFGSLIWLLMKIIDLVEDFFHLLRKSRS